MDVVSLRLDEAKSRLVLLKSKGIDLSLAFGHGHDGHAAFSVSLGLLVQMCASSPCGNRYHYVQSFTHDLHCKVLHMLPGKPQHEAIYACTYLQRRENGQGMSRQINYECRHCSFKRPRTQRCSISVLVSYKLHHICILCDEVHPAQGLLMGTADRARHETGGLGR